MLQRDQPLTADEGMRIYIELMAPDRKLKASREGSKRRIYGTRQTDSPYFADVPFQAKRDQLKDFEYYGTGNCSSQGQNLALTVICVPYLVDSGSFEPVLLPRLLRVFTRSFKYGARERVGHTWFSTRARVGHTRILKSAERCGFLPMQDKHS